jgi:hypothetical protein
MRFEEEKFAAACRPLREMADREARAVEAAREGFLRRLAEGERRSKEGAAAVIRASARKWEEARAFEAANGGRSRALMEGLESCRPSPPRPAAPPEVPPAVAEAFHRLMLAIGESLEGDLTPDAVEMRFRTLAGGVMGFLEGLISDPRVLRPWRCLAGACVLELSRAGRVEAVIA